MNDFTKEELQEIIEMANDIERGSQAHGLQMYFKIRDKAQSMIDNYVDSECPHDWFNCFYGEDRIPIKLCSLCNLREKQ